MRTSFTLSRYVSREMVLYTGLSFLTLTTVLVGQNALRRLDELVAVGLTLSDFAAVMSFLLSMLSAYTLPMASLFGAFFAVSRMSSDGEILAIRASGQGIGALLLPALVMGVAISAATAFLMISVEHRAHRELRTLVETLAARGGMLEAGRFRSIGGRTIYVEERDRDNRLWGVMIADRSNPVRPFTVFAERGRFVFDEEEAVFRLGLEQGAIHLRKGGDEAGDAQRISFDSLEYTFDVSTLIGGLEAAVRPRQMSSAEIRDVLRRVEEGRVLDGLDQQNPVAYELELYRRYTLPLAPVLFAMLAVPLGLGRAGSSRASSAIAGLLLAFGYYSLISVSSLLAENGWMAAAIASWLPNGVFLSIGAILIQRSGRELPG
jgi:lipopolysaccharide export system permease protein